MKTNEIAGIVALERLDLDPDRAFVIVRLAKDWKKEDLQAFHKILSDYGHYKGWTPENFHVVFLRSDESIDQISAEKMAELGWVSAADHKKEIRRLKRFNV